MRGFQATPAFSPDGSLLAFRQSDGVSNIGLYAAVIGGDKPLQLTKDRGDCCPTFSPDGSQIAFLRYSEKSFSIYVVPALGGTEHRVYNGPAGMAEGLTWSGDGRLLVFSESSAANPTRVRISALSLSDSSIRALTDPPPGYLDRNPMYSHDGSHVAFIRSTVAGVSNDIFVMPARGGEPKRLTFDNRPLMGPPAWTADDREIVFSSDRGAATALWRISANGGTPSPVAGPAGAATWPSIPAKKGLLVYEQALSNANIWRLDLKDRTHLEKPPRPIISEKGYKMRPDLSLDGKRIAFESDRLGFWEIWTCNTDGTDCRQVTALHGSAGRARWSPDGRTLAFEFHPNERGEIYLVDVPGGTPRLKPTIPGADNLSPSWSHDGKWLYFASKRGNEPFQAWKILADGGAPIQLTTNGGISPVESPDGRFLYFSKYEQGGLWRKPLEGGEETEVLREIPGYEWPNWVVTREGIYFLKFDQTSLGRVKFLEFTTGKIVPVWNFDRYVGWGLAGSQNGRSVVYIQHEFSESDIMLIKNFR
jgi:Tol biopolymer transport system component